MSEKAKERKSALAMIRSDTLRSILDLRNVSPLFHQLLSDVIQIIVVLDASAVQSELRWRLGCRTNPAARTGLHEAIDSGAVIAVAPAFLKQEIEKYLSRIATETGVTMEIARAEWEQIKRMIRFYTPSGDSSEFAWVDPKDSLYALTAKELDADFVRTNDAHFAQMGVTAVGSDVDRILRDYARSTSVLVTVKLGTGFALVLGWQALGAMIGAVAGMIRRLPPAMQLALGIALTIAALHPRSREWLIESSTRIWEQIRGSTPVRALTSDNTIKHLTEAVTTSKSTGDKIKSRLPVRGKQTTALAHAREVLLRSQRPLTADEVARRILANGYSSRSKTFPSYVRRLLRENPVFTKNRNRLWTFGIAT
ncbi:MAG TPA: hypothetical protein VGS27_34845 [Candidatus Sulfotelmatobacter sp.]|nr:hypothetical protein [Candidatus Sulfotelmatobacter sp.]